MLQPVTPPAQPRLLNTDLKLFSFRGLLKWPRGGIARAVNVNGAGGKDQRIDKPSEAATAIYKRTSKQATAKQKHGQKQ
jgi:hypothetical protein